VKLAEIGLRRVAGDAGPVLHGDAGMRVALDAEAGDQRDGVAGLLGEAMRAVAGDGDDPRRRGGQPRRAQNRFSSRSM
jgi:hypothetical protein